MLCMVNNMLTKLNIFFNLYSIFIVWKAQKIEYCCLLCLLIFSYCRFITLVLFLFFIISHFELILSVGNQSLQSQFALATACIPATSPAQGHILCQFFDWKVSDPCGLFKCELQFLDLQLEILRANFKIRLTQCSSMYTLFFLVFFVTGE